MTDPLIVPSIAMLTGGGLIAAADYLKHRLRNSEDRYMAMYGREEWEASNMDLTVHFSKAIDGSFKEAFTSRLADTLERHPDSTKLLREEADLGRRKLDFREHPRISAETLLQPRHGVYFDMAIEGKIRVVWNHMQTDGVGMWNALRHLFDPNPPLVPYRQVPPPPPFVPELMALPRTARRLVWRGRLRKNAPEGALTRGLALWDARPLRVVKNRIREPFNLVTCGMVIGEVFARHPERDRLNVGMTAYYPFLQGRNKYGVFLCKVKRGDLKSIVQQLKKQTKNPMLNWGTSSAQSYALGRMPDQAFARLVSHYRKQVDVLVSSLPVGREKISLAGFPSVISCHPWELTLPYYFLLVGTRADLHVSFTSRYTQDDDFLDPTRMLPDYVTEPYVHEAFEPSGAAL
ncbi:MAG: hypothetical protein ACFB9M_15565 [Myxococcota bacterium]